MARTGLSRLAAALAGLLVGFLLWSTPALAAQVSLSDRSIYVFIDGDTLVLPREVGDLASQVVVRHYDMPSGYPPLTLTQGIDYTVGAPSYDTASGLGAVQISGKGNYTGTTSVDFCVVHAIDLNEAEGYLFVGHVPAPIVLETGATYRPPVHDVGVRHALTTQDGRTQYYSRKITADDYKVSYDGGLRPGEAGVTISPSANGVCTGSHRFPYLVIARSELSLSDPDDYVITSLGAGSATAVPSANYTDTPTYQWRGTPIEPAPWVNIFLDRQVGDTQYSSSLSLEEGRDFTVTYAHNDAPGLATATVTCIDGIEGTAELTYRITSDKIDVSTMYLSFDQPEYTYTGSPITPRLIESSDGLRAGDYALEYADNTNVGTMKVTVRGQGEYFTGSKVVELPIVGTDISARLPTFDAYTTDPIEDVTYTGSAVRPYVTLRDPRGRVMRRGTYLENYENNIDVGTATVTLCGARRYAGQPYPAFTGTKTLTFKIVPARLASDAVSVLGEPAGGFTYEGVPVEPELRVSSPVGTGKTLVAGRDYTASYENNLAAGTGSVTVTGRGNYTGTARATFAIASAGTGISAGPVLTELRADAATAKAALAWAQAEVDAAQRALAQAQAAYDALTLGDEEKAAQVAARKAELDEAQRLLAEAQASKEDADAAVAENETLLGTARAEVLGKESSQATASVTLQQAQATVTAASAAYDEAVSAVTAAQAAVDADATASTPTTNAGHEEWTALGLFRHIRDNSEAGSAAWIDAQCAIDILTGSVTASVSYPPYQGPAQSTRNTQSMYGVSNANAYQRVKLADRLDAVSLDNFKASLDLIDRYNRCRAQENASEGATLSTAIGLNCRMMAISIVMCDWSRATTDHSRAFDVGENLSWGYSNPYDGWYTSEKNYYKKLLSQGVSYDKMTGEQLGSVGHYLNIVDFWGTSDYGSYSASVTGVATCRSGALYGVAHEQSFYTFGAFSPPNISYGTAEFRARWFDPYYRQQELNGMNGVTDEVRAAHLQALAAAQGVRDARKGALDAATARREEAQAGVSAAATALASARAKVSSLEDEASTLTAEATVAAGTLSSAVSARDVASQAYEAALAAAREGVDEQALQKAGDALGAAGARCDRAADALGAATRAANAATAALDDATNVANAEVTGLVVTTYDGTEKTQPAAALVVTVRKGERSESYTLGLDTLRASYANATAAGRATLTLTAEGAKGSGTFWGSRAAGFEIAKASLAGAQVTIPSAVAAWGSAAARPDPTVSMGGRTLVKGVDYSVSYEGVTTLGTAHVSVTGMGNYKDEAQASYEIVAKPQVRYRTHIQNRGWEGAAGRPETWPADGDASGTQGKSLRLEAVEIALAGCPWGGGIRYRTHVQNRGWEGTADPRTWKADGAVSGTSGQALRLEAIQMELTGEVAERYDVWYRVHAQNAGWMGWARNGAMAGTAAHAWRLEAMEVRLVAKGGAAPGATSNAYLDGAGYLSGVPDAESGALYRTHVQNVGWQNWMRDGELAGTTGRSLRLEGINLKLGGTLSGGIRYRTHIQNVGWEGTDDPATWKSDGEMSGTSGRSYRLEAIQVELTGEAAKTHDVWYRVHAQNLGWLGWARNGESSGTAGYAYRLEGIEVRVLPKGATPPGDTKAVFWQGGRATDGAGRTERTYTVRYVANGGTATTMGPWYSHSAIVGQPFSASPVFFAREGYEKAGWNTEADGSGTAYAVNESVSSSVAAGGTLILYAQWVPESDGATYTVNFLAGGGTGQMPSQTVARNRDVTLDACRFSRDGYAFAGWNTRLDGTGAAFAEGQAMRNLAPAGAAADLYAQWELLPTTYTVRYDANGGSGTMADQEVGRGVATALRANSFTRAGHFFSGWNTRADATGAAYADGAPVIDLATGGATVTLFAQWAPEGAGGTYRVGYFPNGIGDSMVQFIAVGQLTALHRCDFFLPMHVFDHWNTERDGSGTSYGERQLVLDLAPAGGKIALYAQWRVDWAAVADAYGAVLDAAATLDYGYGITPAAPYSYALANLDADGIPELLVRCSDGAGFAYDLVYSCSTIATSAQRAGGSAIVTGVASAGGYRAGLGAAADGPGLVHVAYQAGTGRWEATRITLSNRSLASEPAGSGRIDDGNVPATTELDYRDVSDRSLLRALAAGDTPGTDTPGTDTPSADDPDDDYDEDDLYVVQLITSEPYDVLVTIPATIHAEERTVTKYRTENKIVGWGTEWTCAICGITRSDQDSHDHLGEHAAHAGEVLANDPELLALFSTDPTKFAETNPYLWAELNAVDGSSFSDRHDVPIYADVEVPYEETEWVEVVDEPARTFVEHFPKGSYRDAFVNKKTGKFVRWVEPNAE